MGYPAQKTPTVNPLLRSLLPMPGLRLAPEGLWRAAGLVLAAALFGLVRGNGYDWGGLLTYAAYLLAYVLLPGVVALAWAERRPVGWSGLLALALPAGFALEALGFLGAAAAGHRELHLWSPLVWLALAVYLRRQRGRPLLRLRLAGHHAGLAAALALAFLGTVVMAASQMYAESPLADGLPTRAIFHDWVYLISRAGVIKHTWPLDDPSLAGTPLQYHYLMMVHAAAASWTTGLELGSLLLRLVYAPLGLALVAQAYLLGRRLARTPWGGVLAALLLVFVSEVSLRPSYGEPLFLGLFVRWLFVSPTFFLGMVYCGALLLAVHRWHRAPAGDLRRYAWVGLLAAAGTGAKGTLVPVVLAALGLWAGWRWLRTRRLPWDTVACALVLLAAFCVVYLETMASWRSGDARLHPFHVFQLTGFWKENLPALTATLASWLPGRTAGWGAQLLCALAIFAGTCGVRLLALPYLVGADRARRDPLLVGWLGAFFVACLAMGLLLELNSYGELYLILMMRLPLSVLTAGFLVAAWRRAAVWRAGRGPLWTQRPAVTRGLLATGTLALVLTVGMQGSLWWRRNLPGLGEWARTASDLRPDPEMRDLREALLWIRQHTESDAVLVPNAFTPENMRRDHWGALDRTLMGVHFYYSALAERRLWFEGPHYILDTTKARIRANLAANFFYRGHPLEAGVVATAPSYALIDRHLRDGAAVTLPVGARVFASDRFEVYRLSPGKPESGDGGL